jgi:hypothetical protein
MSYRKGKEFPSDVKDAVWRRADGKDEVTGEEMDNPQFHHIVGLAHERDSDIKVPPHLLAGVDNCLLVDRPTHKEIEQNLDHENIDQYAQWLNEQQKGLFDE